MMGLWFGATAIGSQLVMVPGIMWGKNFNLVTIWGVLAGICLVSALFIFSIFSFLSCIFLISSLFIFSILKKLN